MAPCGSNRAGLSLGSAGSHPGDASRAVRRRGDGQAVGYVGVRAFGATLNCAGLVPGAGPRGAHPTPGRDSRCALDVGCRGGARGYTIVQWLSLWGLDGLLWGWGFGEWGEGGNQVV